jgi:hypothetical protein
VQARYWLMNLLPAPTPKRPAQELIPNYLVALGPALPDRP